MWMGVVLVPILTLMVPGVLGMRGKAGSRYLRRLGGGGRWAPIGEER